MSGRVTFSGKYLGETFNAQFNFLSLLAVGETLDSASVTATVYSGTDAAPFTIVNGAASISGAQVTQSITGGVLGVVYELLCTATTSLGQVLELSGYLPIVPDLV